MKKPFISIIIASREEERYIAKCLDSLVRQDYGNFEILVVDGMSEDKTREILKTYEQKYPFIKLLDNPRKTTPFAFNIGIKNSKGDFVVIMSAHGSYKKDHLSICLKYINKYNIDIVGGVVRIIPSRDTFIAKSIALASSNPFGSGNAYYRTGRLKEPKQADAVAFPCYKKEVFNKIGLFNENLTRSQDMEFNLRLKRAGGKILLVPDIVSYYYPKATFSDFFFHNIEDGIWAVYPFKIGEETLASRHYTPLFFVSSLLITGLLSIFSLVFFSLFLFIIGLYFLASLYFSIKVFLKEKDIRFLFLMPIAFGVRHFGYGLGSVWGLLTMWKLKTES